MALVVKDRVQETSSTTGTGALTLDGAVSGFQTFSSAVGNGNTTYYAIDGGTEWEVGIGTVGAGTLSRDTILESSNGGTAVNLSAGSKNVFVTYPAEKSVDLDTAQTLTNKTISADNNTISGIAASSFVLSNASGNLDGSAAQKAIPTGDVVGTTDSQTLTNKTISGSSNTISNINLSSQVTGTLPVANGGTGQTSYTDGQLLIGNSTGNTLTKATLTAGSGISITNGAGAITIASTASGTPTVDTYDTGTAATWTKPSSANWVLIEIWGGGGSGGNSSSGGGGGGGGGGAYQSALVKFSDLVGTVTYTVGSGGASQGTTNTNGNAGGTTSVTLASYAGGPDSTFSAYGGAGGVANSTAGGGGGGGGGIRSVGSTGSLTNGGAGGDPFGGTAGTTGIAGGYSLYGGGGGGGAQGFDGGGSYYGGGGGGAGQNAGTGAAGDGGASMYGGGGGGGAADGTGTSVGGTSFFGGAGGAGGSNGGAPVAGTTPAGGGGGSEARASGAGGSGRVRFTYW